MWRRFVNDTIKLNFDASFREGNIAGFGMVAWDGDAKVLVVAAMHLFHVSSLVLTGLRN